MREDITIHMHYFLSGVFEYYSVCVRERKSVFVYVCIYAYVRKRGEKIMITGRRRRTRYNHEETCSRGKKREEKD